MRPGGPWIEGLDFGVAEFARIPRDHGKPARGGRRGKEGVGHVIVERLATPALV